MQSVLLEPNGAIDDQDIILWSVIISDRAADRTLCYESDQSLNLVLITDQVPQLMVRYDHVGDLSIDDPSPPILIVPILPNPQL